MTTSAVEQGLESPTLAHARDGVRHRRRTRFARWLVAVTAVIHLPVALACAEIARRTSAPHPWLVGASVAALGVAGFLTRSRIALPDRRRSRVGVWLADVPYLIHWCAALWMLIPSALATVVGPLIDLARGRPPGLPMGVYMWGYLSGLLVCAYGTLVRRRRFRVVEREVRIPGLDPALAGLRIAHLSDLHIGALTPKAWGFAWAAAANRQRPDLAVITGDLLTSGTEFHEDAAEVAAALEANLGVFVSMGNHDYFGDGPRLCSTLAAHGVRVLRNEGVLVERGGARLWIAGVDDTWTKRDDVARAMRDRPFPSTAIVLSHDPDRFDQAAAAGAELVLAGHTHAGQIAMPFMLRAMNLARLTTRYSAGFFWRGRSTMYVNPGLGTTGPPMRLGAAPEVTILVLKPA